MIGEPIAFFSYAHEDDRYDRLTKLREELSHEIGAQIGRKFHIFSRSKRHRMGRGLEGEARGVGRCLDVLHPCPVSLVLQ
jgi:hypothetical protein